MSWGGPERYEEGHGTYYVAENFTLPSSNKVEYGQRGTVVGPLTGSLKGKGVLVQFPGNSGPVQLYFTAVRRTPISPSPTRTPTPTRPHRRRRPPRRRLHAFHPRHPRRLHRLHRLPRHRPQCLSPPKAS